MAPTNLLSLRASRSSNVSRLTQLSHSRAYSEKPKTISPHVGFYKSFGRPIAKVFLMSIAIYQITYWSWKKLEATAEQRDKLSEIDKLETQLKELGKDRS